MKNFVSDVVKLIDDALVKYENPQVFYYYMHGLTDIMNVVDALTNDEEPNTAKADEPDQKTFFEPLSGRFFGSTRESISNAYFKAREHCVDQEHISLNDWYAHLGLLPIWNGDKFGWSIADPLDIRIKNPEPNDQITVPSIMYTEMPKIIER